jgi:GNAT superfamily N-acetyltransferase
VRRPGAVDVAGLVAHMDANLVAMWRADVATTPGAAIVEGDGLAIVRSPHGTLSTSFAVVTGPTSVAALEERTAAVFGGRPFSVWTREHADAALAADLVAAGFAEIHREPAMVLMPDAARPVSPPSDVVIRPVEDDAGRAAFADVVADAFAVYDMPPEAAREHFTTLASVAGPDRQAFLAWRGAEAVAGAIVYLPDGVGGIGWVGARPSWFGRGYGPAVTSAAVAHGLARGARFLNLQASPMGAPVYARMGFVTPTHYRWFLRLG